MVITHIIQQWTVYCYKRVANKVGPKVDSCLIIYLENTSFSDCFFLFGGYLLISHTLKVSKGWKLNQILMVPTQIPVDKWGLNQILNKGGA